MKVIILLVSILSFSVFSLTPAEFCRSFSFIQWSDQCIATIHPEEFYYDINALQFCSDLTFDDQKFECLKIVKNTVLDEGLLELCKERPIDAQKVNCVKSMGGMNIGSNSDVSIAKSMIRRALIQLNSHDIEGAKFTLSRLLRILF